MAKPKAAKKAPAKKKTEKVSDDKDSDLEIIAEISDGDASDASSSKGKSRKSQKPKGKKSPREKKSKTTYKDDSNDEDSDDEQYVPLKKGRKTVELILEDSSNKNADNKEDEKQQKKEKSAKTKKEPSTPKKATKKAAGRPKKKDLEDVEEEKDDKEKIETPKKKVEKRGRPPKGPKPAKKDDESSDEEVDPDVEWEVEKILDVRNARGGKEFHIKWKGFPSSKSSWEPEENLGCPDIVADFMAKLEKNNLPRTRRMSTIHATQSSKSSVIHRVMGGRVFKRSTRSSSRSRTPTVSSSSSSSTSSNPITSSTLVEEVDGKQTNEVQRQVNGDLTIHKFMKESVQEKLRKIESRSNSVSRERGSNSSTSKANTPKSSESTSCTKSKQRFGRYFIKPVKWILPVAGMSAGAYYLINTPSENFNWQNIAPAFEQIVDYAREGIQKLRASAPQGL